MTSPTLIFIPGWGTDSTVFREISENLKMQSICMEWWKCLSGSTNSNALHLELESTNDPVVIVGWSLGGMVALSAAIKYQTKILGLLLISTTPRMIEDGSYYGVNKSIIEAMTHKLKKAPAEVLKDFFLLCVNRADRIIPSLLNTATKIGKEHLLSGLLYLQNTDLRNELGTINIPVRIVHGQRDRVIGIKNGIYLSKKLPVSEIKIFQEKEHLFFHDNPSSLANEISSFVNSIVQKRID